MAKAAAYPNADTDVRADSATGSWRWGHMAACRIDAPGYKVERFIGPAPFNGIHGLAFDPAGRLHVASLAKRAIFQVDIDHRLIQIAVGSPDGEADDIAFGPDGTMYWTDPDGSMIRAQYGGKIRVVASDLPGINGIAFRPDGRLYASTVFNGDALYEIDPAGITAPRVVLEGIGGLNGFAFGPDDRLYGPLWFNGQVARIDVDTKQLSVIADGFMRPSAVKFDAAGGLWMVDAGLGQLFNLDRESGTVLKSIVLKPSVDNLAIDGLGHIYVTNMADNGLQRVDSVTGSVQDIFKWPLSLPGGIALERSCAGEILHIADQYSYRQGHLASGVVSEIARRGGGVNNIPHSVSLGIGRALLTSLRTRSLEIRDLGTGERLETVEGFQFPCQAVEVPAGIVVADYGEERLILITGEAGARQRTPVGGPVPGAVALLASQDGSLYVADATGTLSRADSESFSLLRVASGLDSPEGLADLNEDEIVISEVGQQRLVAIHRVTGARRTIASGLPIGLRGPDSWPKAFVPTGVAVGTDGSIYFSSDIESALYRLRPAEAATPSMH